MKPLLAVVALVAFAAAPFFLRAAAGQVRYSGDSPAQSRRAIEGRGL
jgi:hypothetical protein